MSAPLAEVGGWAAVLDRLSRRLDLDAPAASAAMQAVLAGAATPAQIAGFLLALRTKGETDDELAGFLDAMDAAVLPLPVAEPLRARLIDTCGTGGDGSASINVSTLAALVAASAGAPVAKHGNRAASSRCGSADLLEALGVAIDPGPEVVARCVEEVGIGFCFAPRFHPAARHAAPVRRELGVPTVFNLLGPMANPTGLRRQVLGVADRSVAERILRVLARRGATRAMVVSGDDGLDELTTTGPSLVWELRDGDLRAWRLDPSALGLAPSEAASLCGGDPAENAALARRVLDGESGPQRDVVALNAAAALLVADVVADLETGLKEAVAALEDGRAAATLDRLVAASQATAGPA